MPRCVGADGSAGRCAGHVGVRYLYAERLADELPPLVVDGPEHGDLLVVSWGSPCAAVAAAVQNVRRDGRSVAHAHFRYLNPLPRNTGKILRRFHRILASELNRGQLRHLLRSEFLLEVAGLSKLQGRPFLVSEIEARIEEELAKGNP